MTLSPEFCLLKEKQFSEEKISVFTNTKPVITKNQECKCKLGISRAPVVWVVLLSAHDDGLEHGTLSHHKLDHPVDEAQQVPGRTKDKGYESMNE